MSQLGISDEEFDDYLNSRFDNSLSNLSKNEERKLLMNYRMKVLTKVAYQKLYTLEQNKHKQQIALEQLR